MKKKPSFEQSSKGYNQNNFWDQLSSKEEATCAFFLKGIRDNQDTQKQRFAFNKTWFLTERENKCPFQQQ